jgi:hypothetical protein
MENPDRARHTRSFVTASLVIAIALVVGLPAPITRAQDPSDAAKQAFADWKAALQKRDDAKQKVAEAQAALATARAASLFDKKLTDAEKATLKNLENAVAEAQAALQAAEDELFKAAEALEKALLDLPEDSEVRKDIKRQRDAILHPTTKVISSIAPNAGVQVAQTKIYGGVSLASFDTAYGTVKVTLPDDIAPGDTISGTVTAEPSGKTDAERRSNAGQLSGYVVEINTPRPASNEVQRQKSSMLLLDPNRAQPFTIDLPNATTPQALQVNLMAPPLTTSTDNSPRQGPIVATVNYGWNDFQKPEGITNSRPVIAPADFKLPTIGQQGWPIEIIGPFDGNSANTSITMRGDAGPRVLNNLSLIVESPRKAVFSPPTDIVGTTEIQLQEGKTQTKGQFRNIGITLSAPKTNLLKGEKTMLTVQVSGLEGITNPVPLTLSSHGVITMDGGNYQPLNIQPSQVTAGGLYSTTRGITGIQTGGWEARGIVVTCSFDTKLEDDGDPLRVLLFNMSTGEYTFNCPNCKTGTSPNTWLTGKGKVTMNGCTITLQHYTADRKVLATLDGCSNLGNGTIELPQSKTRFSITDRNITDITCPVH